MDKRQSVIFLDPVCDPQGLVAQWARDNSWAPVPADRFLSRGFRRRWNQSARRADVAIWVGYPVRGPADLNALEAFARHLRDRPGAWYYAPRPNDFLPADAPALVGMSPMHPITRRRDLRARLVTAGRRILQSNLLPRPVRRALRRLGMRLWGQSVTADAAQPATATPAAPQVHLPDALRQCHAPWQPWQPPDEVRRHHLVDRAVDFFPHPRGIHVVLLNQCNLKCVMCPYHAPRYRAGHTSGYFDTLRSMTETTFHRIAEYAGPRRIRLQLGQIEEPMLHPKFFDFVRIAKHEGVPHVHVTTNGTLLNADRARRLADSGIDSVMFSIDAVTPEAYRDIRGSDLAELEANIRAFLPLARRRDIWVTASFILQGDAGQQHHQEFLQKWRALGVDAVTFYVLTEHDPATGALIRTRELYDKGRRYPCASPWVQAAVFPEGQVSLCCKTLADVGWTGVVAVGNLNDQPFETIWSGPRFARVRRELLDGRFDEFTVCRDCCIWSATSTINEDHGDLVRSFNETMETFTFVR